jgi:hypothetical protein
LAAQKLSKRIILEIISERYLGAAVVISAEIQYDIDLFERSTRH